MEQKVTRAFKWYVHVKLIFLDKDLSMRTYSTVAKEKDEILNLVYKYLNS